MFSEQLRWAVVRDIVFQKCSSLPYSQGISKNSTWDTWLSFGFFSPFVFSWDAAGALFSLHDITIFSIAPGVHECDRGEASILLNIFDRDNFRLTRGACALGFLDLLFSILSTCDPIFESVLVLSVPSWAINEGDATLRRLGFAQSESDLSLLSTSSWLRELVDLLRDFPHSDPESSLFLPSDDHAYLRQ